MKCFICRLLIIAFTCNILLPGDLAFAQNYTLDEYDELFTETPYDRPSPLQPEPQELDLPVAPWEGYASSAQYNMPEPTTDPLLGRDINYDAKDDARLIKRGLMDKKAQIRQFLANAPKNALVEYLAQNPLPLDSYQMGMNDYIPGLHVKKTTEKSSKAALKSLTKYYQNNELSFQDFITLLQSPAEDIATFGAYAISQEIAAAIQTGSAEYIYPTLIYAKPIQDNILQRLETLHQSPRADVSVTPGHRIVQSLAPQQTQSANSVELRGIFNLLLAQIHQLYQMAEKPELKQALAEQEASFFPDGTTSFLTGDQLSPAFYAKQKERLLKSLDYARTPRELVMENNPERLLNADYVALTMVTYGLDDFIALVNFIDKQNTNLDGSKEQYRLNQYNTPFLRSAFTYLAMTYLPLLADREIPMDPAEKTKLVNTLIRYTNTGSAPVQVLALDLLTQIYQETNPKWTRGQGYDKGAAGGPAISQETANKVADRIKTFYCRIDHATRSAYGLNSQQMQETAEQLAKAYNRVRRDTQGSILPLDEKGRPTAQETCYVRDVQTRNQAVYAQEMTDSAMNFILYFVAFDGALYLIRKGSSFVGSLTRLANQARKMPAGQRLAFFQGTLKQRQAAKKMAKELAEIGASIERVSAGKNSLRFTNALTEVAPKGETLGYRITQRFPGGKVQTTEVAGEVVNRASAGSRLPVSVAQQTGTLQSVTELAEKYVTKIPQGVSPTAYKEAVATENLFKTGLEEISASNFKTGYGMKKVWYKNPQGQWETTFEPVWVDLAKQARIIQNSAGIPLNGLLRKDLIRAVSTPGAILQGAASRVGKDSFQYWVTLGKVLGGFAALDVAFSPVSQLLDGTYHQAPEGSSIKEQTNQLLNNISTAVINYDDVAGTSLLLPFVAIGKSLGWVWDQAVRSGNVSAQESQEQLDNNPYLKNYLKQLETDFETESKSLVDLWKQTVAQPDDLMIQQNFIDKYSQMSLKYSSLPEGELADRWAYVYQSLLMGMDPFDSNTQQMMQYYEDPSYDLYE